MITVIFDTETTGLIKPAITDIKKQPSIIEIYCLKIEEKDGEIKMIDEFESFINPKIPISAEITRITGIDDHMVRNEPEFIEIWEPLAEFFTGVNRVVAHNLTFDRSMLANELMRIGKVLNFPWPKEHICTVEKTIHIEQRRMNLTRLHEHLFGENFPDAHRAKSDVMPLYRCYKKLREDEVI